MPPEPKRYYIKRDGDVVEAWSERHIPNESTKDWRDEFRVALRREIFRSEIGARRSLVLEAWFASDETIRSDIENLLFYNLHGSPFLKSAPFGLRFREVEWQAPSDSLTFTPHVYYRYALVEGDSSFFGSEPHKAILSLEATFPTVNYLEDCSSVWYALKQGTAKVKKQSGADKFCILVTLRPPKNHAGLPVNLGEVVKRVFDAIVCAMHWHVPPDDGRFDTILGALTVRVQAKVPEPVDRELLRAFLLDQKSAVLGGCNLIRMQKDGCKWYPSDHLCVQGELLLEEGKVEMWGLEARVFSL